MRPAVLLFVALASACSIDGGADSLDPSRAAALVSSDLVIAEVYSAGGNVGSIFDHDFVVLFNRGAVSQTVSGLRLTYASVTGDFATSGSGILDLPDDDIPPGGSYLVRLASGGTSGMALNAEDASGSINMSASAGKIALTTTVDGIGGCGSAATPCDPAKWIDLVGWGSGATQSEGSPASATGATAGLVRAELGCTDTGDNGADFRVSDFYNLDMGVYGPLRSSATRPTACPGTPVDLGAADLARWVPPDLGNVDAWSYYSGTVLLNEVKWNPAGSDNGQEFIEIWGIPSGTVYPNTYVVSVDGDGNTDGGSATGNGRITYARDLSGVKFGTNGLILIKSETTTIPGISDETTVITDSRFNGSPLENGSESVLILGSGSPLRISIGYTYLSEIWFPNVEVIDSIAARDATGFVASGVPAFAPCPAASPNAVDGASRRVADYRANSLASWVAGQAFGTPMDQGLTFVTECSGGPASWLMSPGRPNNDPYLGPPDSGAPLDLAATADLAASPDAATPPDLAVTPPDLAVTPPDLAASPPDLAATPTDFAVNDLSFAIPIDAGSDGGASVDTGNQGGCAIAPRPSGSPPSLLFLAATALMVRRPRARRS